MNVTVNPPAVPTITVQMSLEEAKFLRFVAGKSSSPDDTTAKVASGTGYAVFNALDNALEPYL